MPLRKEEVVGNKNEAGDEGKRRISYSAEIIECQEKSSQTNCERGYNYLTLYGTRSKAIDQKSKDSREVALMRMYVGVGFRIRS